MGFYGKYVLHVYRSWPGLYCEDGDWVVLTPALGIAEVQSPVWPLNWPFNMVLVHEYIPTDTDIKIYIWWNLPFNFGYQKVLLDNTFLY